MPSSQPQYVCKACGKPLPAQAMMSARKGYAARCACGASVRVAATPAAAAPPGEARLDSTSESPNGGAGASGRARSRAIEVPGLGADSYRCPSCNAAMASGTVLCVACGFNLNTGKRLGGAAANQPPRPSPSARRAASAFGVPKPARPPTVAEDRSGQVNQILLAVAGMLLLLGIVAGGRMVWNHFNKPVNYVGDDGRVAELMDDSGATEIHAWFAGDSSRIAGGMSTVQALGLADMLQRMGAKQVLAFGSRMTRTLAVELPDNPQQRKALFDWYNERYPQPNGVPMPDKGQHYLLLGLGL